MIYSFIHLFIYLFIHLFIYLFIYFVFTSLCASVNYKSACVSICKYVFLLFCLNFPVFCVSDSVVFVSLFVCLFGCYSAPFIIFSECLYCCYQFNFVTQSIVFYFIFSSIHWGRIRYIEFEWHYLPLPFCCMSKPFKGSTYLFVLFVLQRVTFCFCLF